MPAYYFDTSALAKRYHYEAGSARVDLILQEVGRRVLISRLAFVEMRSVFAGKVRSGSISAPYAVALSRLFHADVANGEIEVLAVTGFHLQRADALIGAHGFAHSLRTLDAIQLAVAADLRDQGKLDYFVAADKRLCDVADLQGIQVIRL